MTGPNGGVRDPESLRISIAAERVDGGWQFVFSCPRVRDFRVVRTVPEAVPKPGAAPLPLPPQPCPHEPQPWCLDADPDRISQALKRLRLRSGDGGISVGHYLFAVLLGEDWPRVGELARSQDARRVELALTWPRTEHVLSRLPWELMHDGRRYLSTSGGDVPIAVTRVVAGTAHGMPELSVPPRVLFVVGAALTDVAIRPGTEMLSLLREVRAAGRRVDHRVLENASPDRLTRAVASYRPEIVHFICHGGETADRKGYLRLQSDEDGRNSDDVTADRLSQLLAVNGAVPPVVVLSACDTGGATPARLRALGGPELAAPLAADLVHEGVAVVVAMAGTVADRTCRIFTRTWGAALAAGVSLVTATAEARRLAFAEVPGTAGADWALPAVFFSDGVEPDDVRYTEDPARHQIDRWLGELGGDGRTPVFCAREAFFDTFWSMLSAGQGGRTGWEPDPNAEPPSVLAICVEDGAAGVGKTRLLEEFERAALENGHLPLLLGASSAEDVPADLTQLVSALGRAMATLAFTVLGLPTQHGRQLAALGRLVAQGQLDEEDFTRAGVGAVLYYAYTLGPEVAVRQALSADAAQLLADARETFPAVFTADSRVVVLLDNLGRQSEPLLRDLFKLNVLSANGLGHKDIYIPAVLTVRYESASDIRRELFERGGQRGWLHKLDLRPFDANTEEDLLAYERVLLHPFRRAGRSRNLQRRWVFDRSLGDEDWTQCTTYLRDHLEGMPAYFHNRIFDTVLDGVVIARYVLPATDEDEWQRGGR